MTRGKLMQLRDAIRKASVSLGDADAVEAPELFAPWSGNSVAYSVGARVRYGNHLYKVRQAHTSQADWTPDIAVSLYEEVVKSGQGKTPDNPIAYNGNMALENGKYYSQYDVVYICVRDTINPVYANLSDLIGLYVQVWTG